MYTEARKIHLIEQVLKVNSEELLQQLESVFNKPQRQPAKEKKVSIYDFVGVLSKKEIGQMKQGWVES
ncbi:hypothetical protein SAMN05421788_10446 [Filimonas lacunae]|uniref:Uncharacterized protein n=1 Tax=Filimonas lacunae TaxID=477680 RepID=A0A173M9L2_9BACT|nr:hypothetical protein [Filimonas lacunae]BAV04225.1 hypothetical protein FLA_0204 [Filimonas lacunae]SIT13956.1 hypothetical protein SAMN05421788_10446 [Filimonas lacunae]